MANRKLNRGALALAAVSTLVAMGFARAGDVTWTNGQGNSRWDTTSANWNSGVWKNDQGDGAIFTSSGVGVIDVTETIDLDSIKFEFDGYELNGSGRLNFVLGTSTLSSSVVEVPGAATARINVGITALNAFQKIGEGVLEIGNPSNVFGGAFPLDGRASLTADVIIGGSFGDLRGGTLRLTSGNAIGTSTTVGIGNGYLDIGNHNVTLAALNFTNQTEGGPWNSTLNGNNGVVGSGTLRVLGEINVLGVTGSNFGNSIATNLDLGGGTQIVRVGAQSSFMLNSGVIFSGTLSNGSLVKAVGFNSNGVLTSGDGISLLGNNTYEGSSVFNLGQSIAAGTNATSSIMAYGQGGPGGSSFALVGANGSALSATVVRAFSGAQFLLDNNAAFGTTGNNFPTIPAAQNNNRLSDSAAVELRDGTFVYRGFAGAAASETVGSLAVLGGHNTVTLTPNGGGSVQVSVAGNMTLAPRATLTINASGTGNTLGGNAKLLVGGTVPAADSTGIIGRVVSSADFLTYNAANGFTPLTTYSPDFSTAGTNVAITAATTVASSVNINALKRTGTFTLSIAPGQTLGITSGMILNTSGTGTTTGGTLAFGANPGVLFGTNTISSAITGSAGLIAASGTATLSGDLSGLAGSIDVNSGTLSLGTGTFPGQINVRIATLNVNVSQTAANLGAIRVGIPENEENLMGGSPSITIGGAGANAIIDRDLIVDHGMKTISGLAPRYSLMPGFSPLSNSTGSQTWAGDIELRTSLRIQGGGASATSTGATRFSGTLSGAGQFFIANGRVVFTETSSVTNGGGIGIGDLGFTAQVSFLGTASGNGPIIVSGGNRNSVSYTGGAMPGGLLRLWNSGASTAPTIIPLDNSVLSNRVSIESDAIVHVGTNAATSTPIAAIWAGPLEGAGPLVKTGTGTLTLSNTASTYNGLVTVSAGTLKVNGAISSSVNLATAATLAGTGTVGGDVNAPTGSTVSPGNSIGTLIVGSLTLGGTLKWEFSDAGGTADNGTSDRLSVSGLLDLSGSSLQITALTPLAGLNDSALVVAEYDTLVGTFGTVTGLPSNYELRYAHAGNTISLVKLFTKGDFGGAQSSDGSFNSPDGSFNELDVEGFLLALNDQSEYLTLNPTLATSLNGRGDFGGAESSDGSFNTPDGAFNELDVEGFLLALNDPAGYAAIQPAPRIAPIPEPAAIALLAPMVLIGSRRRR